MKRKLISARMLTLFMAVVLISSMFMTFQIPAAAQGVGCLHPDVYLCEGVEVNDTNLGLAGVGCDPEPGWYPDEGGYTISIEIVYDPPSIEGTTPAVGTPDLEYTVTCIKTPDGGGGECQCYHTAPIYIVEECAATAEDFTICVGDPLYEALFVTEGGAGCSGGCDMEDMEIDSSAVLNMVPGSYKYYVTCDNGVCEPDIAEAWVTVESCEEDCDCIPYAPDITLCIDCGLDQGELMSMLVCENAGCPDDPNCTEIIDVSQVDLCSPGDYTYSVTCVDDCGQCPDQTAYGTVTVEPLVCVEIIEVAGYVPEFPCPGDMIVPVSSNFFVKADIENCSGCILPNVTPFIRIDGPAVLIDDPDHWNLGNMEGGSDADSTEVAWTLHCIGPGEVYVEVWVNDCSYDYVIFDQREPADLTVVCSSPCEWCTNCAPGSYKVLGLIENIGDTKAVDVYATITATPGTDVPATDIYAWQTQGPFTILPDASQPVEWTVNCTGEGDTVFTIDVTGTDLCSGGPLVETCQTTTLQRDVLVDVCADRIDICPDGCCDDDIVVSVGQYFDVTATIKNCTDADTTATVTLNLPEGSLVVAGTKADLYCADWIPQDQQAIITKGYDPDTAMITVPNLCDCCTVEVTWHLQCDAATTGDGSYSVDVTVPGGGYTYSNEPCDPVTVVQEEAADLTLTMQGPFVMDCDCDQLVPVDAVAVCQDYDVLISVINTGEADATGVIANIEVSGATDCEDTWDVVFGVVEGLSTKSIWLSDTDFGTCHCDGEDPEVRVKVITTEAYSNNTCEAITVTVDTNLCNPGLLVEQCDINVAIINPEDCDEIDEYEVYAVTARIENCGTCSFENALVTLMMEGNVALDPDSENPVLIDFIEAPDPNCEEECRYEEVTWMVKCLGDGDVYFDVCVETETPHLQIKTSDSVYVEQVERDTAAVCVEIVAPHRSTIYATSEDFAITAKITNLECCAPIHIDQAKVEIGGMDMFNQNIEVGDPVPAMNWTIGPGQTKIVTWTAHCTGSGLSWFYVHLEGISDEYEMVYVDSEPVSVWQYPAAHLEVEIIDFPPDPIVTSTVFDVVYTVTNTGEADATEVYAILSVEPEGSVRVAGPSDGGYTQYLGTIPGHGSEASSVTANYTLHCKVPCDSTIKITVEGKDEYGWHMKQACASTGSFVIENGMEMVGSAYFPPEWDIGEQRGFFSGMFIGDANGLFGPFNATSPVSWAIPGGGPDFMGEVSLMGSVIPNLSMTTAELLTGMMCQGDECLCNPDCNCECLCDMLVGKDMMVFNGHIVTDTPYDELPDFDMFFVGDGILSIINGQFSGAYIKFSCQSGPWVKTLLGGEYCSNMAATAGLAIPAKFIEFDEFTVKQLPKLADLDIDKIVDEANPTMGDTVTFTITLDNFGPSDATSILVRDILPDELAFESYDASQGWYDETSGYWDVGDLTAADDPVTLEISVKVNTVGVVCNRATVEGMGIELHDPVTANNMAQVCIDADESEAVDSVILDLDAGLNLISLPLIPDLSDPEDALASVNAIIAYQYRHPEYGAPSGWVSYTNGTTWNPATGFFWDDGIGYWLSMVSPADDLVVDGKELESGAHLPPSYDVYGGWNLIGFKSTTAKLPTEYLAGIAGKYVMIYGYDNGAFYAVGSPGHGMLQPGFGYWLAVIDTKVGAEGTIYP